MLLPCTPQKQVDVYICMPSSQTIIKIIITAAGIRLAFQMQP